MDQMIAWLDSSSQLPDDTGLRSARAAGIQGWAGYLATKDAVGLGAPWPKSNFDRVKAAGLRTMAYVSGWDDPSAVKAQVAAWGIELVCLDVENEIRGDGPWVQSWLTTSGAGLYGNAGVHVHEAPFHILANYPGFDPGSTWLGPRPNTPCGWQWQGTHTEFGVSVDRCWMDDWFAEGEKMNINHKRAMVRLFYMAALNREPESVAQLDAWANQVADDGSNLDEIAQKIMDSTEGQASRALISKAKAIAAGEPAPGTQGAPGPLGPVGG